MIVWTKKYPTKNRPLGYVRLLRARYRWFDRYSFALRNVFPYACFKIVPGYQNYLRYYRDFYRGRRCFVMGNGPSLKKMNLSPLRNEITIGSNGIYKQYDEWGWFNNFLIFEDIEQTELRGPEIEDIHGPIKMAALYNAYAFKQDGATLLFNSRLADKTYWENDFPCFSKDFSDIVYLGSTVTYIALQWAFYLGCNPVYLIGVDHNYGKLPELFPPGKIVVTEDNLPLVRQCHFSDKYYKIGDPIGVPNVALQETAYAHARLVYESQNRRIINAGVDSKLTIFETCNFNGLF